MKDVIELDGVKYIREKEPSKIKILILQRGWVVVGRISREGSQVSFSGGYVIRRWGTEHGIGQLAAEGPLKNTQLDPLSRGTVHELAIVAEIDCEVIKWQQHIK